MGCIERRLHELEDALSNKPLSNNPWGVPPATAARWKEDYARRYGPRNQLTQNSAQLNAEPICIKCGKEPALENERLCYSCYREREQYNEAINAWQ